MISVHLLCEKIKNRKFPPFTYLNSGKIVKWKKVLTAGSIRIAATARTRTTKKIRYVLPFKKTDLMESTTVQRQAGLAGW